MTREEAIQTIQEMCKRYIFMLDEDEAIDMAIESLRADTVSRSQYQGLLNAIGKVYVEVVRCEDCRHWTEEKDEEDDILYGWCRAPFENDNLLVYGDDATRIFTAYDFFCKSGKRREHGKDEAKET